MRRQESLPLGMALGLVLATSYALCVGFGLVAPESLHMYKAWEPLLPGFEWRSVSSFVIGQVACRKMGQFARVKIGQLADVFQGLF